MAQNQTQTRRIQLHQILKEFSDNVYYQPPESLKLKYPCIVYTKEDINTNYADDKTYSKSDEYLLTVIGLDPDIDIPNRLLELPYCTFDRRFTGDNLYHDVLRLYF